MKSDVIGEIVRANRAGAHIGIPSYCTAHPQPCARSSAPIVTTICGAGRGDLQPVNQHGGYTGMNPQRSAISS